MTTASPAAPRLTTAYGYLLITYLAALAVAVLAGYLVSPAHPLWVIAVADIAGTLVIFGFSRAFNNSSFYDPYWSLGPIAIAVYLLYSAPVGTDIMRSVLVSAAVILWGLRLTYNFLRGWPGLHHEDWRYVDFRENTGKWYWLVSFSGIHLFPTVMVYFGCLALFPALHSVGAPLGLLDFVALVVITGAILIETLADEQLRKYVRTNPAKGTTLDTGLWAWSRHPNYFGEMGFWWALFLFGLAASPATWWPLAGPAAITLMFFFASIPMIEKRMMIRRKDYADYKKRVPSPIILWPPSRKR